MMDVIGRPEVERAVFKTSSQVGKTEILNNILGYFIHLDPGPMLVVQPTIDMARAWASDRLEPMQRDTPALAERVRVGRTKAGRATKLHKTFPGGHVTAVGANAPAGLASRPIRVVLFDEVDRFPISAGKEGDPVDLATKRTKTFHDRKLLLVSTPTTKDESRIDAAYLASDQRVFEVPCPHCGAFQRLMWAVPDPENAERQLGGIRWTDSDPDTTKYQCEHCAELIDETSKRGMLEQGQWIAKNPGAKTPGFHLSALYSPWTRWSEVVAAFLEAKDKPEQLKVWTNTELGETWDDGERIEAGALERLAEAYDAPPRDVRYVTCGVDVQENRLEALTVGWGVGDEAWSIEHKVFTGNPEEPGDRCWKELDAFHRRPIPNEDGVDLWIQALTVDSGYLADAVYSFCHPRYTRRVFSTKGKGGQDIPIVYRRQRRKKDPKKCPVFTIGTDASKDVLFERLKKEIDGPGRMHFRQAHGREFFEQVTSEVKRVIYSVGRATVRYVKTRARNEALDLLVLNLAALLIERPLLIGPVREPDPPAKPQLKLELEDENEPPAAVPGARRRDTARKGWDIK